MRTKQRLKLDIEDTRKFKKISNKRAFISFKSCIKNLFLGKFNTSKRCFVKALSLMKNKYANNYPPSLADCGKKTIAVYTALYGDYDDIKPIKTLNPFCDYYIFTDQKLPDNTKWVKKEFSFPNGINTNVLKNRYLKMHPHLLFSDYKYAIYVDAVFSIELDIFRLLARMGEKKIGIFRHYSGISCLYLEAERLKRIGKADPDEIDIMMKRYNMEGFPHNFGFYECGIIIQKMNDNDNVLIMNKWWTEFVENVKRDQWSFMYSLWRCGYDDSYVASLGATFWDEPTVKGTIHKNKLIVVEDANGT